MSELTIPIQNLIYLLMLLKPRATLRNSKLLCALFVARALVFVPCRLLLTPLLIRYVVRHPNADFGLIKRVHPLVAALSLFNVGVLTALNVIWSRPVLLKALHAIAVLSSRPVLRKAGDSIVVASKRIIKKKSV
jgi:hypothetical protein